VGIYEKDLFLKLVTENAPTAAEGQFLARTNSVVCGKLQKNMPTGIWAFLFLSTCCLGRLALNSDLIAFDSENGEKMLTKCMEDGQSGFLQLIMHWESQIYPTYCGIASSACVLNALQVRSPKMDGFSANLPYFTQKNLLGMPGMKGVIGEDSVRKVGLTLDGFSQVLQRAGGDQISLETTYASAEDVGGFRERIINCVYRKNCFILVNYLRNALKQLEAGHISPIGAYYPENDLVLILDVSKYKYPPVWVPTVEIFAAMNTIDSDSNKTRGFVEIRRGRATQSDS
jgi:hypothetical protein